jgi:TRAP-type transport system periplasmic protein
MKTCHAFGRVSTALAVLGVGLALTASAQAQPVVLKFATALTPTNPILTDIYEPWAKRINEAAAGEFQVQVMHASFASTTQVWERTVSGVADMSINILSTTGMPFSRASITTVPGLSDNTAAGAIALWRLYATGLLADEFKDVHVINLTPVPKNGLMSKEPITKLEDLKGLKVRAIDKNTADAITSLGGTPIGIPFNEAYQALSRGVVSAAIGNAYSITAFKFGEVAKHMLSGVAFGMTPSAVVMNKDTYAKLSPKGKAIMDRFSGEMVSREMGEAHAQLEAKLMVEVRKGMTFHDLAPGEAPRWKAALEKIAEEWATRNPDGPKVLASYKKDYAAALAAKTN